MDIDGLIEKLSQKNNSCLCHFTDEDNIQSIKEHGLLSKQEAANQNLVIPRPSGNEWSREADHIKGIFDYVSLALTKSHPMLHSLKESNRIKVSRILYIDPEILRRRDILFSDRVANNADATIKPLAEWLDSMDTEALFERTNWRQPEVNTRRCLVEKYEILVPKCIPVASIRGL